MTVMTTCLHGGTPSGHGHQVPATEMTKMKRGKVTVPICFSCRKRKLLREKGVPLK